jgi:hypothetical protein
VLLGGEPEGDEMGPGHRLRAGAGSALLPAGCRLGDPAPCGTAKRCMPAERLTAGSGSLCQRQVQGPPRGPRGPLDIGIRREQAPETTDGGERLDPYLLLS